MANRYIDGSTRSGVIVMSIVLIAISCGIVLGTRIANAPFIGANVGCAIGCLIVGKLLFAKAKPSADSSHPSATQPEE